MSWRHADRQPLTAPPLEDSEDDAGSKAAADSACPWRLRLRRRRRRRRCRIADDPPALSETARALARAFTVFGLGAAAAYLGLTGAYEIAGLVVARPGAPSDVGAPAFRLYKNSQFAACAHQTPPRPINCTLLEADLDHPWRLGAGWIGAPRDHYFLTGARYQVPKGAVAAAQDAADEAPGKRRERYEAAKPSWCDLVSCMAGWKVVPSVPRAAALGPTALAAWWSLLVTALGSFGALRGLTARAGGAGGGCAPAGLLDRVLLAWEAGQLGFWWWAVPASLGDAAAAAAAGLPPPTALTGWIVPWVLAAKCGAHPWSCYLAGPTRRRLAAALHAVAALQWAATVYMVVLLRRRRRRPDAAAAAPPHYDCFAAGVAAAPGQSPCSPDRLCASPFLFRNPDFAGMDETAALGLYAAVVYLDMAAFPLHLGVRAATSALARWFPRPWKRLREARLSPFRSGDGRVESRRLLLGLFLVRGYLHLLYALPFFVSAMDSIVDRNGGFATVAYDLSCRAVHVGVSPKHFYLDIDAFDRGLRVVRQWFNA